MILLILALLPLAGGFLLEFLVCQFTRQGSKLWKLIPPEEGNDFCHRLVNHGREVCTARTKPHCDRCCLADICEKNGV